MNQQKNDLVRQTLEKLMQLKKDADFFEFYGHHDFSKFSNPDMAKELVAQAFLGSMNADGRRVNAAIDLFWQTQNITMLKEITRLAMMYGNIEAVLKLKSLGFINDYDFKTWFRNFGIKWFDLYQDDKKGIYFIPQEHVDLIKRIVIEFFDEQEFWLGLLIDLENENFYANRRELLKKVYLGQAPVCEMEKQDSIDSQFRDYCQKNDILIIKRLQEGTDEIKRCSFVYLAQDSDGIIKVFKELLDYNAQSRGIVFDNEDRIYQHLLQSDFIPKYYGTIEVASGIFFIKQSVVYGHLLSEYIKQNNLLSPEQVIELISDLAQKLNWLQENDVLYLDIKPENILLTQKGAMILDFGISRILKPGQEQIDIYLADYRYATPEGATIFKAGKKSDVFALGVLFHQLLYGRHPFALSEQSDDTDRQLINYIWPNVVLEYEHDPAVDFNDSRLNVIEMMLEKDLEKRISFKQVAEILHGTKNLNFSFKKISSNQREEKKTLLFPARMGIPHKGHVEFISRLLHLGYYVIISLQKTYTITDRDPIPKWLVAKMVAQSLFDLGFDPRDFEFIYTPFYLTQQQMKLHFIMLEQTQPIQAIASGNEAVHELFLGKERIDQKTVFGTQGEHYEIRSWGEYVRDAVRRNDYQTFCQYAASGVERILSFKEIQEIYCKPQIEFVPGRTEITLLGKNREEVVSTRAIRYRSPEKSLVIKMTWQGKIASIIDAYAKNTVLEIGSEQMEIAYVKTEFEQGNERVIFKIV